jgi:hypothetical protein
MATTKKVAAISRGVKRTKPAAVSVSKAKTGKKAPKHILKTQKVSPRTSSLKIKNNTVRKSEVKKKLDSKLQKVEAFHVQKNPAVLKKSKGVPKESSFNKFKPALELALLSPYRFPIDTEKLAVGVARYGGVLFVVLGAFFSLFYATNSFSEPQSQTASLSNTYETDTNFFLPECDSSGTGSCSDTTAYEPKPSATFDVNNPSSLTGNVQVRVKVPDASSVKLMAYYKTQSQEMTIGRPSRVSSDTWEMYWNTDLFDEGEYKLKALIENRYGTYEAIDSKYVQIVRTSLTEAIEHEAESLDADAVLETDAETDTEISDDESEVVAPAQSASLTIDKRSDSEFRFEVKVEDAERVKLYVRPMAATERKLLDYAYKSSSDTWRYRWLPNGLQSGEYVITAVAVVDDVQVESNTVRAMIGKGDTPIAQEVASTPVSVTGSTTEAIKVIAPEISLSTQSQPPLSKVVPVLVDVKNALSVEIFALPKNALVQKYLGSARLIDADTWSYRWDTLLLPNGEYKLIAYVKNAYGNYTKETSFMKVQNELAVVYTEEQQEQVKILTDIGAQEIALVEPKPEGVTVDDSAPQTAPALADESEPQPLTQPEERTGAQVLPVEEDIQSAVENLLASFRSDLDAELQRLATALRLKDPATIDAAKFRLETLKKKILNSDLAKESSQVLVERIDSYLKEAMSRVEEDVVKVEKVIAERTAQKAVLDSDSDGVSDYDEVNIYSTNPFGADSDNDGFTDGAEILSGFDPLDSVSEAAIAFESPKETGIVRDDILSVSSIITAQPNEGEEEKEPAAIISGKALPNSFVTLYIFSTPIVVTIKTDDDGSWNYRFDKELENGEHQVYVGITDNAGKIVAKSNPFTFVKEAQAFTANTASDEQAPAQEQSFISEYMVYLVLSISVVAIGLVLILLGLHLDSRQRRRVADDELTEAVI